MNLLVVASSSDDGGFHGPTIGEFFPPAVFFVGTPFEINRIVVVRLIAVLALILLVWLGTRRMKVVPGRFQSIVEMGFGFVRVNIAEDVLGKKEARRFLPVLTAIFFMVLAMNVTSIIPGLSIAGTSVIGVPLLLAVIAYVSFIYAGVRNSPKGFFANALFPPGVPKGLYVIVAPLELISTFILRPITLTLRLLMNMVVGHLLLVLFFAATSFFLLQAPSFFKLFGIGTLVFGLLFTLFELLVIFLQSYIFALLTAVYIQLAVAEEH